MPVTLNNALDYQTDIWPLVSSCRNALELDRPAKVVVNRLVEKEKPALSQTANKAI